MLFQLPPLVRLVPLPLRRSLGVGNIPELIDPNIRSVAILVVKVLVGATEGVMGRKNIPQA